MNAPAPLREIHYVMGTLLGITLYHQSQEEGKRALAECFQEARRLEEMFSAHDDDSDLNQLNRHAGLGPIKIDRELRSTLEIAVSLHRATDGAMDITVGPLIDLWSAAEQRGIMPSPALVTDALYRTGIGKIRLLPDGRAELTQTGMRLDLGGLGKGYAVDRLRAILAQAGIASAFINFGRSSLAALGSPPGRTYWSVLIEGSDGASLGLVHLNNQCLGVSESCGRSFEIGGIRLSHLIDPRDGCPLRDHGLGVAAARTATEAEALTKAITILDGAQGPAVISRFPEAEGLLVHSGGRQMCTPRFTETVRFEASTATLAASVR